MIPASYSLLSAGVRNLRYVEGISPLGLQFSKLLLKAKLLLLLRTRFCFSSFPSFDTRGKRHSRTWKEI